MKKIIKKIYTVVLLAVMAFTTLISQAQAGSVSWANPNTFGPISNVTGSGLVQSTTYSAFNYQNNISANAGDKIAVLIYLHNNGNADSTNTYVKLTQPSGSSNSFTITGFVNGGGASKSGSTTISLSSNQTLTYIPGSLRVSKDRATSGYPVSNDTDVFSGSGLNIGNISGMHTCGTDALCHQGSVAIGFQVSNTTTQTYQCNNGDDDDGDGLIDMNDPGCDHPTDNNEYNTIQSTCQIDSFNANPSTVAPGGYTTLSWNTTNCTQVSIDGINYPVDGSGNFGPIQNGITYQLYATNSTSSDSENRYVNVTNNQATCRIDSFNANPSDVPSGGYTTLSWNTTNCTQVSIDGINYPVDGSGSFGPIWNDQTYQIYASNSTSSDNESEDVDVISNNQSTCRIDSFYASPSTVSSGGYTTLRWNTTNCNQVNIDGINYPVDGSGSFGPLWNGRTYNIYANNNSSNDSENTYVSVTNQNNNQTYQCNDGYDNDGDGRVDMNDAGCSSSTDNDEYNYIAPVVTTPSVTTITPTNLTSSSARINGSVFNAGTNGSVFYFEWGTNSGNLSGKTTEQSTVSNGSVGYYETLFNLQTGVTYYYRAVVRASNGAVYRGDIRSFILSERIFNPVVTTPIVRQTVTQVQEPARGVVLGLGTNLVQLRYINNSFNQFNQVTTQNQNFGVQNPNDGVQNICVDDTARFVVEYRNISNVTLTNAILHIDIPKDVEFRSSSAGVFNKADNTITVNVGTLIPGQSGQVSFDGLVLGSAANRDLLVVPATLSFENPNNGARETAIAYGLATTQNCLRTTGLASFAFGSGFLPDTLIEWLLLILIVAALIYLIRRWFLYGGTKRERRSNERHYEDLDVPTAPYHH